jgi:hypothetical protein
MAQNVKKKNSECAPISMFFGKASLHPQVPPPIQLCEKITEVNGPRMTILGASSVSQ